MNAKAETFLRSLEARRREKSKRKAFLRRLIFITASLLWVFRASTVFAFDHSPWDSLLKAHVVGGLVDYGGFLKDKNVLDQYLNQVAHVPIEEFANESRENRIAAWINTYNASVIRLILSVYPVDSVEKIHDFWNQKIVEIAGMRYSLKEVRENVFRRGFRDERATLALVSGTMSSGPLRIEAYEGPRLGEQLRDQMNVFLSDARFNRIGARQKKLHLSPLFRELRDDFVLGYGLPEGGGRFSRAELAVLGFIRIHVSDPLVKEWISGRKYRLRYLPVDLSLNRTSGKSA